LALNTLKNTISWVDAKKDMDVVMSGKIDAVYRELYLHPNHNDLMLQFRLIVEQQYPYYKWLSNNSIKDLYNRDPENFLFNANLFFSYH